MKEGGSEGGFLSLKTPMGIITSTGRATGDGDEIRARYRRLPRLSKVSLRLSRPSLLPCAISRSAPLDATWFLRSLFLILPQKSTG